MRLFATPPPILEETYKHLIFNLYVPGNASLYSSTPSAGQESCYTSSYCSDKTPLTDPSAVAAYERLLHIFKYAKLYCRVSLDGLIELCLYGCFSMCVV